LNKPAYFGSDPFPVRIFTAPGPDPTGFTETNPHFPQARPHSEAVKHTVVLGHWRPFVWCPVTSPQRNACALLSDCTRTRHSSRTRNCICTAQQKLTTCRLRDRNTSAVERKAVVLRQTEYYSWANSATEVTI